MSTSEFDEQASGKENDLFPLSLREKGLPCDFSEEDMAFAQELESLFSPQDEEVPPYFVQTLLEPDHPRFKVVEQGFELKTCAHVLRRLKLHRRIFRPPHTPFHFPGQVLPPGRPILVLLTACMLFALVTMITTGTSFANGMVFLWSGAHSGVSLVRNYPQGLSTHAVQKQNNHPSIHSQFRPVSLFSVQQKLLFPMYWPESLPDHYSQSSLLILNGPDQNWADGPVIQLNYDYSLPGVKAHGTGHIAIREFKPMGKVLQVVMDGAAHQIAIGNQGSKQKGIYVDGQWNKKAKVSRTWVFGTRSELIYEHNGIIFWIVGNQHDGINGAALQNIAASMAYFNITHAMHIDNHLDIMSTLEDSTWAFSGDVIYLDGPRGTSWSVVDPPPPVRSLSKEHLIENMNS